MLCPLPLGLVPRGSFAHSLALLQFAGRGSEGHAVCRVTLPCARANPTWAPHASQEVTGMHRQGEALDTARAACQLLPTVGLRHYLLPS